MGLFLIMFYILIPAIIIISIYITIKIMWKAWKKIPDEIELYKKKKYIIEKEYEELKNKE